MHHRRHPTHIFNSSGFTLLEIAIVMVIIGILTGGGISLMKILTERKARNATVEYLQQARSALISFAENNGRLPWADSDGDGAENSGSTNGTFPYLTLQIAPADAYRRVLHYEVNANLTAAHAATCGALKTGLSGRPAVVDSDGSPSSFSVAAVLVSAGPMDADSNGNVFDRINSGTHQGNNATGSPYLRHPPIEGTFDDLTTYIGGNELFGGMCEYLNLAVNNTSGVTVHVYDATRGSDAGTLTAGSSGLYSLLSGTRIELRSGGGGIVSPTTPPTPIILAGRDATINIP
jgi:prepilin-type N-terminal cleavage/methylation domain-containing protein